MRTVQYCIFPVVFGVGVLMAVRELIVGADSRPIIGFLIGWCILSVIIIRKLFRMPTQIVLKKNNSVVAFRNLFSKNEFNVRDLKRVKVSGHLIEFSFNSAVVEMDSNITGLHELLHLLKENNKQFDTDGC